MAQMGWPGARRGFGGVGIPLPAHGLRWADRAAPAAQSSRRRSGNPAAKASPASAPASPSPAASSSTAAPAAATSSPAGSDNTAPLPLTPIPAASSPAPARAPAAPAKPAAPPVAPATPPGAAATACASYDTGFLPLVHDPVCSGCHAGGGNLPRFEPFAQAEARCALIGQRVASGQMPPRGGLSAEQKTVVASWVALDCPETAADAAALCATAPASPPPGATPAPAAGGGGDNGGDDGADDEAEDD